MRQSANKDIFKEIPKIIKGIYKVAATVSSFDLKLLFFSDKIRNISGNIRLASSDISSATSEISISTEQIAHEGSQLADTISRITADSETINMNFSRSNGLLKSVLEENAEVIRSSEEMKAEVDTLLETLQRIKKTIKGISDISEQTNILAINASIEAARAGAAGQGFNIVAKETKNLSETTRSLLNALVELVDEIDVSSQKSSESVQKTLEYIHRVNGSIESVSDLVNANVGSLEKMSDRLTTIAASGQQISSSLSECAATIESINTDIQSMTESTELLEAVSGSLTEMSESMDEIESKVDSLTIISGQIAGNKDAGLSNDDFIKTVEDAVTAHKKWLATLKSMTDTMEIIPIQTDGHKCGFGHFYYSIKPSSKKVRSIWDDIETFHESFHRKGAQVIECIKRGDRFGALPVTKEAEELSHQIINSFAELIKIGTEMNKRGEQIL